MTAQQFGALVAQYTQKTAGLFGPKLSPEQIAWNKEVPAAPEYSFFPTDAQTDDPNYDWAAFAQEDQDMQRRQKQHQLALRKFIASRGYTNVDAQTPEPTEPGNRMYTMLGPDGKKYTIPPSAGWRKGRAPFPVLAAE